MRVQPSVSKSSIAANNQTDMEIALRGKGREELTLKMRFRHMTTARMMTSLTT